MHTSPSTPYAQLITLAGRVASPVAIEILTGMGLVLTDIESGSTFTADADETNIGELVDTFQTDGAALGFTVTLSRERKYSVWFSVEELGDIELACAQIHDRETGRGFTLWASDDDLASAIFELKEELENVFEML